MRTLRAEDCKNLEPRIFVVNHGGGESLASEVQQMLAPIQTDSMHSWMVGKERSTDLYYHVVNEYWAWIKGWTLVTIRLPDGKSDQFEIGPGWIVYCARGVERGHQPLEDWGCFEWVGICRPEAHAGHLQREL
jgi:hypothetical protein